MKPINLREKAADAAVAAVMTAGLAACGVVAKSALARVTPTLRYEGWTAGKASRYLVSLKRVPVQTGYHGLDAVAYGTHPFVWQGSLLIVTHTAASKEDESSITLRAITGGMEVLEKFRAAVLDFDLRREKKPMVWSWTDGGAWSSEYRQRLRPLSSVILDGTLAQDMLDDLRNFMADEAWYVEHHVPYRRGYLLHGAPGSGKTTLIGAVASELSLSIYSMSLADPKLTDAAFEQALRHIDKGILVIEDVDAVKATHSREGEGEKGKGELTLAGVLNALDGLGTAHGLKFILTTNHRERLDPALIRPGRVDFQAEVGLATRKQAEQLFVRFFPGHAELAPGFAATVPERELSPAAIQEHLVRHRFDPEGAARGFAVPETDATLAS